MIDQTTARQNLNVLLQDYYHKYSEDDRARFSEADVVRQFLDRLFRDVLGWPIQDNKRYKYEMRTAAGRPDITFFPEKGGTIFIEAKKFGIIKELRQARFTIAGTITPGQMALPGMAVDRTEEEQQAINYAFENGGQWAILTNFEKLRLFNARRDWLVLSFESPGALLHDFDLLWQLSYPNILNGSLDALSSQRHTENVDSVYLDFINEWRERLARDVLSNLRANPWARRADGSIDLLLLRDVVQRFIDRLVLIRFAEDHLVIPAGTLYSMYELRRDNFYAPTLDYLVDHLFRRFDSEHNSALFSPGTVDEAVFSDEALLGLIGKLYEARYRAMSADILGSTYEQYLGKTLALDGDTALTRDNLETRKKQGSYYTPQVIVRYIVDHSLGRYLYGTADGRPDGEPLPGEARKTASDIRDLRVLDAACGSGSFLIYAYQVLADFYEGERARLEAARHARKLELARAGVLPTEIEADTTVIVLQAQLEAIQDAPRLILERHLYGVDLDPQAAEIAVVNLMMRAMEGKRSQRRLPLILNQNVKTGNSLVGLRHDDPRLRDHAPTLARLRALRLQLIDPAYDDDHPRIAAELEAETAAIYEALNAPFANAFRDLQRARPFHWGVEFPEVFYDEKGDLLPAPGFTIILGNPPWEIVKPDLREYYAQFDPAIEGRLSRSQVEARIAQLDAENPARRAEWDALTQAIEDFAAYVRAAPDYARQGRGDTATHKLFLERAYGLLRDGGRLGYVVPSGLYTDLGTKDLREMLLNEGHIDYIFGLSNVKGFFPGVDSRFKFCLLGAQKGTQTDGFLAAFRYDGRVAIAPDDLPAFLANCDNLIYVRRESIRRFSPNSLSVMEFQSARDYEVAERIYGAHPLLGDAVEGAWNVKFTREFDMTNDRDLFNTAGRGLPLYEGKMIHQFDAFYAPPQYWVEEDQGRERLKHKTGLDYQRARLAFRDIARGTDERTLISAVLPPRVFCNNKVPLVRITDTENPDRFLVYVLALFNSFVIDFLIRQKVSTTLNFFYVETLPVPRLSDGDPAFDAIVPLAARLTCTRPAFAGLWQSVMGSPWDESKGATDAAERQKLRDQIDALVARLYGLSRADYAHILGAFPLVFLPDAVGAARRAAALAAYDAL